VRELLKLRFGQITYTCFVLVMNIIVVNWTVEQILCVAKVLQNSIVETVAHMVFSSEKETSLIPLLSL
jgi:hypothetical protein